jgi:flagellar motility protein MotE (MotC chaperone)
MKKIGSLISVICIINILMLAGLVGFLWGTGRLNKPKAQAIADLLRQPGAPQGLREKVYEIMAPSTQTKPATSSAPATRASLADADPASAQERIDYMQKVLEEERLRLESEAQNLHQQQELLASKQNQLDLDRRLLNDQKRAYEQTIAGATTQSDAAGFQKSMALFDELKPKQVKDLLVVMPPDQIARYFAAMEPDRAAKIIAEFKSTTEKDLLTRVLDKVRGTSSAPGTGAASTSPAASQPVAAVAAGKAGP